MPTETLGQSSLWLLLCELEQTFRGWLVRKMALLQPRQCFLPTCLTNSEGCARARGFGERNEKEWQLSRLTHWGRTQLLRSTLQTRSDEPIFEFRTFIFFFDSFCKDLYGILTKTSKWDNSSISQIPVKQGSPRYKGGPCGQGLISLFLNLAFLFFQSQVRELPKSGPKIMSQLISFGFNKIS